ncbi:MFS general substrate transporter [Schizophyllum commune H4-8]|uniref:MFS general substrate transporter n=1 Tax=Schizophyllum commune (strain H4-8 / FGSC 9210) TaxID=578458 RepID=UPI0021601295|nr:MFS general substrate transporter [Schizophyllum commune H4-8]KAI5897014.1 MFS general substrate transporter [Schizophyllum commune H4-8]
MTHPTARSTHGLSQEGGPRELEVGPHSTEPSAPPSRTREQIRAGHLQFPAACYASMLAGWNDGTTGPLLPRIHQVYGVNYAVVSLLFVCACVGFLSGALINIPLSDRLGYGEVRPIIQIIACSINSPAPPFLVLCVSYAINGIGMAIQDAQSNGYVASLTEKPEAKMGMLHAAYGLGALTAPLVSTQFSQMHHWSFHYLASLGLMFSSLVIQVAIYRFRTRDDLFKCLALIGQAPLEKSASAESNFRQIFRLKNLHLLAVFVLVYVGVEVTIGGWIVTYVIDERGGGPSSGYISSGFFAGLMIGRLALLWVNAKVGEWPVLFVYALLAIGLELVVWLVPSLIGGGVAVALVGVILGACYPIAMNQAARILPAWLITPCIGWIAGFGQAGSAVLPLITGALAQSTGIKSLQPFLVSMMGCMMVLWAMVPRKAMRMD